MSVLVCLYSMAVQGLHMMYMEYLGKQNSKKISLATQGDENILPLNCFHMKISHSDRYVSQYH